MQRGSSRKPSSSSPAASTPAAAQAQPRPGAASSLPLGVALNVCPTRAAAETLRLSDSANKQSQQLCEFVLENVLVHEAAAQQLQASTSDLVKDGQELLAVSRQLQPLLERVRHTAAAARELRSLAQAAGDAAAMAAPLAGGGGGGGGPR